MNNSSLFSSIVVGLSVFLALNTDLIEKAWNFVKEAWDKRPTNRVYICKRGGIVAVVRARDYNRAVRRFWRRLRREIAPELSPRGRVRDRFYEIDSGFELIGVGPIVFYNENGGGEGCIGSRDKLLDLLGRCRFEHRKFYVPWRCYLVGDERERGNVLTHEQFWQLIFHQKPVKAKDAS